LNIFLDCVSKATRRNLLLLIACLEFYSKSVLNTKYLGAAAPNSRLVKTDESWESEKFSEISKMEDVEHV